MLTLAWVMFLGFTGSMAAETAVAPDGSEGGASPRVITPLISFQGFLTDALGNPLGFPAPVMRDLEFTIYDLAAGGAIVWGPELHAGVTIDNGVFQVRLGSSVPLMASMFSSPSRWVQVRVIPGGVLTPRTQLTAVPFAFRAAESDAAVADDGDWTKNGTTLYYTGGNVGIGQAFPSKQLEVDGSTMFGQLVSIEGTTVDASNDVLEIMVPDTTTTLTQYIECQRGTAAQFRVDVGGNVTATGGLNVTGGTVNVPADEIQAAEIEDEPGATGSFNTLSVSLTGRGTTDTALGSTITPPADGNILAIANGYLQIPHVTGTSSSYQFGLSDDGAFGGAQDINLQVPAAAPSGTYYLPFAANALFPATANTSATIELLVQQNHAPVSTSFASDLTLSCVYLPTEYGTVSTQRIPAGRDEHDVAAGHPLTNTERTTERTASIRANEQRMQRELDEMRARLQAVEAALASAAND